MSKANERKIKHLVFEYYVESDDPQTGNVRLAPRQARQGETVVIPRDADRERGDKFGAFFTDAELKNADAPAESVVIAERTDQQLIDWINDESPTVDKTVGAAQGDPALAQRILDAETAATGGEPRKGVIDGLAAVLDAEQS